MRTSIFVKAFAVLVTVLVDPLALSAEDSVLNRWALIASSDVVERGLADLVIARLSENPELELVERERLEEAIKELRLSALTLPSNVAGRLQLGQVVRADALVVMSIEQGSPPRLNLTVCDCNWGVRLWQGSFSAESDSGFASCLDDCDNTVKQIRRQFSGGVKQIIAVPPFLSEDFRQDYSFLQTRFRDVLAAGLTGHEGVAIVEVDEARAIGRELREIAGERLDRPISLFVEPTYSVSEPTAGGDRRVVFKISSARSDSETKSIEKSVPLEDAAQWLTKELTGVLLSGSENHVTSLSTEAQYRLLSRRANQFADVGDWQRSAAVREAALALKPSDFQQRARLVNEYRFSILRDIESSWRPIRFTKPVPKKTRELELRRAAFDYCVAVDHISFLVRSRQIFRDDAIGLFGNLRWFRRHSVTPANDSDPIKFQSLHPARAKQREFLHRIYPRLNKLLPGRELPRHLTDLEYGERFAISEMVAADALFGDFDPDSLGCMNAMLTRAAKTSEPTEWNYLGVLNYYPKTHDHLDAWMETMTQLSEADHETAQLYGRYALAVRRKVIDQSTVALETLLNDVRAQNRQSEPIHRALASKLMLLPVVTGAKVDEADRPRGKFGPLGRLKLDRLAISIEGERKSRITPRFVGMMACGNFDAYWTKNRFFTMQEAGVLKESKLVELSAGRHILFWEPTWDGECLWLHVHGRGIVALDRDGTVLATFNDEIPGYWKGHKIIGLSPRRAFMVGSFGKTHRAWCGLLTIDDLGRPHTDIILEAKSVPNGQSSDQSDANSQTTFVPRSASHMRDAQGHEFVIVEREGLSPLRIDLSTREISVTSFSNSYSELSTVTDQGFFGRLFVRDGSRIGVATKFAVTPYSRNVLLHGDWLYRPGYVWTRQNILTLRHECLQSHQLSHKYCRLRIGRSAHYGLIAFDPTEYSGGNESEILRLMRVTILDNEVE